MRVQEAVFEAQPVWAIDRLLVEQVAEALAELVVLVVADHDSPVAYAEGVAIILAQWKPTNLGRPAIQRLAVEQRLPALAALRHCGAPADAKRHSRDSNAI